MSINTLHKGDDDDDDDNNNNNNNNKVGVIETMIAGYLACVKLKKKILPQLRSVIISSKVFRKSKPQNENNIFYYFQY